MAYWNILLIEDDEDDQIIFQSVLSSITEPISCIAIGDATEALEKLQTKEVIPDLIFLGLNLPVENGQQFLAALKKKTTWKTSLLLFLLATPIQAYSWRSKGCETRIFIRNQPNLAI